MLEYAAKLAIRNDFLGKDCVWHKSTCNNPVLKKGFDGQEQSGFANNTANGNIPI